MTVPLPVFSERDLLSTLPPTTSANIRDWETQGFDLDQIGHLLTTSPQVLGTKAATSVPDNFWAHVKEQVRLLICTDDPRYANLRDTFGKEGHVTINVLVSSVSAAIGTQLGGIEVGLIMPLVVVSLMAVARVSKEAWCAQQAAEATTPSSSAPPDS